MAKEWDVTSPVAGVAISDLPAAIRLVKTGVRDKLNGDHITFADGATSQHAEGSARAFYQSGDPATNPGGEALNEGRLSVDSDTMILTVFDSTFKSVTIAGMDAATAGGDGSILVGDQVALLPDHTSLYIYKHNGLYHQEGERRTAEEGRPRHSGELEK